ncbi:hypothetical protein CC78DRAFT_538812 [Lojkania enalia]|uniref:Uncharacterized protein n=1 Tax=Lojkania enalia TaxID=147567 RepID=A0A9P4ND78_9PLEO|nr:hypothetical protein CC78DRAFT_538812 [Didymosphaeria enalia]
MRAAFKGCLTFVWAIGLIWFLSPIFAHTTNMQSLDSSFIIEVDGKPIAKVSDNNEDRIQAKTGSEAALFTLKDGRLYSDDWILGRAMMEDRSLLPKPVLWFKSSADSQKLVQPVTAHQNGDSYQIKFADACLIAEDGNVFADLQGGEASTVTVQMK